MTGGRIPMDDRAPQELEPTRGRRLEKQRLTILTGGTGFLGRELLASVLDQDRQGHVLLVLRSTSDRPARKRVADLLLPMYQGEEERKQASGLEFPDPETYLTTILSYVREADWGRRAIPRPTAGPPA